MFKTITRYALIATLVATSLIALLSTLHADAAAPYFSRFTAVSGVYCGDVVISMDMFALEYVAPDPGQLDVHVINYVDGAVVSEGWKPVTGSGTQTGYAAVDFPSSYSYPLTYELRYDSYVDARLVYRSRLVITCEAYGPATEAYIVNSALDGGAAKEPIPGCDMMINLPSNAVVGAFVSNAPLFYAPGKLIHPYTELEAGKTAWVLGQDASGDFYKILWSCTFAWVTADRMGPNYDAVWNGTPLPITVVD
jgi:hypothetical protein